MMVSGCALWRGAPDEERELLAAELGRDPVELLTEIATAADADRARELVGAAMEPLSSQVRLRMLRYGLGHAEPAVVLGAAACMHEDRLPVPELGNAARIVVPRLGNADCHVPLDMALPMIGSVDFEALLAVVPRLPEEQAVWFLGACHRMARPDGVPALCALALATDGAVRKAAYDVATLVDAYRGGVDIALVESWLQLVGKEVERDAPGRLPPVLLAALRAWLDVPLEPAPPREELDARLPGPPFSMWRWLHACTPGHADLPLLAELMHGSGFGAAIVAAWCVAALRDDTALALLAAGPAERRDSVPWLACRARCGDGEALEQLFAGDAEHLAYALTTASDARRRDFFVELLGKPREEILAVVSELGNWPRGAIGCSLLDPPYDERCFEGLEPLLANAVADASVLRAFVGALPCCETTRLADLLLAAPAAELFAGDPERVSSPWLGHGGVWAFLEVTRPHAFARRLREGLDDSSPMVRDFCARCLVQLGIGVPMGPLVAWLDAHGHREDWVGFAQEQDGVVLAMLAERVAAARDVKQDVLAALAVALGMPPGVATRWSIAADVVEAVRAELLRGAPAAAFVCSCSELPTWSAVEPAAWADSAVAAHLLELRQSYETTTQELYMFDQAWTATHGDAAAIAQLMQPLRDGRYATHDFPAPVAAQVGGLSMLPFWVDELGTNCCKAVLVEEVLEQLFGQDCQTHDRSRRLEPARAALRRTLLPFVDRLRWSRLARGYVMAGA